MTKFWFVVEFLVFVFFILQSIHDFKSGVWHLGIFDLLVSAWIALDLYFILKKGGPR